MAKDISWLSSTTLQSIAPCMNITLERLLDNVLILRIGATKTNRLVFSVYIRLIWQMLGPPYAQLLYMY